MAEYWLVTVDKSLREIALLKIVGGNAEVIAGDKAALLGFKEGKPDTLAKPQWQFQLITCHAWFPAVGESIDRLGPVVAVASVVRFVVVGRWFVLGYTPGFPLG